MPEKSCQSRSQRGFAASLLLLAALHTAPALADIPYLGEVRCFGFNFAPQGWAPAQGQLLPIAQNSALFALLGTTFGGNGVTNFALPDLRDRVIVGAGTSNSGEQVVVGQAGGTENALITPQNLPPHVHLFAPLGSNGAATSASPAGNVPAVKARTTLYAPGPGPGSAPMAAGSSTPAGTGGASIGTAQPYVTANCSIALQGIFPSQN